MCGDDKKCDKADACKAQDGKCTPEQVKICHGEDAQHDCKCPEQDKDK